MSVRVGLDRPPKPLPPTCRMSLAAHLLWLQTCGRCCLRSRAARVPFNSQGWFLTDFSAALAIVGAYLVMVTIGPKIMADASPIDSYPVRFVYNVVQVRQLPCEIGDASP